MGHLFHSSFSNTRNGVLILVHKNVSFILPKQTEDAEGRIICIEAVVEGVPLVLCNIYALIKGDPNFFHEVNKILGDIEGEIVLAGDFNEIMDPVLYRSSFRPPLMTKEREALHMLNRDVGLTDIWRLTNPNVQDFTFFSHCHKTYSRIDLFLISTSLTDNVADCNIMTISFTDHAPVELFNKANLKTERRGRWRLNTGLLMDSTFRKTIEEDLKIFLEINIGSTEEITTLWEASKAYIRGKFIAKAAKNKRENLTRIKDLEKEIKDKELDLSKHFLDGKFQELCELKYSLHEIYNKKAEYALCRLKKKF